MTDLINRLQATRSFLQETLGPLPSLAIVLGSGWAGVARNLEIERELSYAEIPHWKTVSVQGHVGKLILGRLAGVKLLCLQGRWHHYEGHPLSEVVYEHRSLAWSGVKGFLLTNAAGSLSTDFKPTDLVLIRDHINLMSSNPLKGPHVSEMGERFVDLSQVYDRGLGEKLKEAAAIVGVPIKEGVYVGLDGPTYETAAEVKMFRLLGGDVVGMSTVPEAIALCQMKCRVVGLSCVTNLTAGISQEKVSHQEVLDISSRIADRVRLLLGEAVGRMVREIEAHGE